jgi:predicted dehydrogenase
MSAGRSMKTTRWGILGTGAIAWQFAEALQTVPGAELRAVGSRSREGADRFGQAFAVPRAHATYEELARDPDVDVVYVATPNAAHRDHCLLVLEHGKAVLCEKPFTVDGAQAREVIEAARRARRFCMEGMWMRFAPLVGELEEALRGGAIGEVRMVTASLGFPIAFDPRHRVFDPALGGGAMLDLGVYPLSFAFRLLGRPTDIASQAVIGESGVDEQAAVLLTFSGGRQAVLTTSVRSRLSNDATIVGTHGIVHVHAPLYFPETATVTRVAQPLPAVRAVPGPDRRSRLSGLKNHPIVRDVYGHLQGIRHGKRMSRRRQGNGYAYEATEVGRCLAQGLLESPVMPLDESLAIIETIDVMRRRWAGQPVERR